MQFESAPPSIVRSVRQRDLLNTWLRLRVRADALPMIGDYNPARLEDELKDIVYYVVQHDRPGWCFIIDSHGSRLAQAYGKSGGSSSIGTDLRDYVGPAMVDLVLPIYEECASRALPVYSISLVNDINGRTVAYERLLMPFFTGNAVSHIIASLKTISEDGRFEINNLLRDQAKQPDYKLRAVIDRDLAVNPLTAGRERNVACDPPPAGAVDIVEI
jgi:hypothetical protein